MTSVILGLLLTAATRNAFVSAQASASANCVAPSAFDECMAAAESWSDDCHADCLPSDADCIMNCGCVWNTEQAKCILSSCWNQVYGCEYQTKMINILSYCPLTTAEELPYFPAPDDGPGACACNLGQLFETFNEQVEAATTCQTSLLTLPIAEANAKLPGCQCCGVSGAISSMRALCPDTNTDVLFMQEINEYLDTFNFDFNSTCNAPLDEFNCVEDLGFPALPDNAEFYAPTAIPTSAVGSLTNLPGMMTSPLSGYTLTWTGAAVTATITATSAAVQDAETTSGSDASSASDGAASQTSSATEPNGATKDMAVWWIMALVLTAAILLQIC